MSVCYQAVSNAMEYAVEIDGVPSKCRIKDDEIIITNPDKEVKLNLNDVISCEEKSTLLLLWYIQKGEGNKLTKHAINLTCREDRCEKLQKDLTDKISKVTNRPKKLLVLINPIGGNATGQKDYHDVVEPVFNLANISCDAIVSERSKHMGEIAHTYDFSKVDGVVICGGDGSYHEVVNVLMRKRQEAAGVNYNNPSSELKPLDLPIALIPTGTGNAVVEATVGCRDILTSALHVVKGTTSKISLMGIYADSCLTAFSGIAVTIGSLTDIVHCSDRKFRMFGRLRYFLAPFWVFVVNGMRVFRANITFDTKVSQFQTENRDDADTNKGDIVLAEGKKVTGFKSFTDKELVYEGSYKAFILTNGNLLKNRTTFTFDAPNMYKRPRNMCTANIFYDCMSTFQILNFIIKGNTRQEFHEDERVCFSLNVQGGRIKVQNDKESHERGQRSEAEMLEHSLNIDGEIYEIDELDIQHRIHNDVVTLFTSYFEDNGVERGESI